MDAHSIQFQLLCESQSHICLRAFEIKRRLASSTVHLSFFHKPSIGFFFRFTSLNSLHLLTHHTAITKNGLTRLAAPPTVDPAQYKSDKKITDEEILKILEQPLSKNSGKNKKKKKKAAKKTGEDESSDEE